MSTYSTGGGMRTGPTGGVWFILLGVVWIILGLVVISMPLIGTLAFVWLLGLLLVIGGVLHTVHAFMVRDWRGFLLYLLEGLLSIVIGVVLLVDPVGGAIGLTLLIGIFLIMGGVLRSILAFRVRQSRAWTWLLVSGVLELLLGVVILFNWPGSAAWVIGLFIGIRMLFSGTSMIALGLSPRGTTASV
jgi:uncharacterized membrane protein HdeD (DUF308 family)